MILAINSSTAQYSVALLTLEGVIVAEYIITPGGNTFTDFMPSIDLILNMSGSDTSKIGVVAVAIGPGSFTGLRVGLSAAKGIAYSMKIPLIGISGTEALASSISYTDKPVCAMITSRRDEAFFALFTREKDDKIVRQSDDKSMNIKEIGAFLDVPAIIVGNDFEKQKHLLEKSAKDKISFARQDHWNLRASSVGVLGLMRFHSHDFDDVMEVVPDYLRPPDIRQSN